MTTCHTPRRARAARLAGALAAALAGFATGCGPDLGAPASLVSGPRVLAVRATPAEAAPGDSVELDALVVDTRGIVTGDVEWALCTTPKPSSVDNIVADACLADAGARPLSTGPRARATIPADACNRFGPLAPGPDLRARDPDVTGGYFQPVRVRVATQLVGKELAAFGLLRLRCDLAQAPLRVTQDFRARYRANRAPALDALQLVASATLGEEIRVAVESSRLEGFVRYDAATGDLVDVAERFTVSWFATAGRFSVERSDATSGRAEVAWRAPSATGAAAKQPGDRVWFFVVLRDSRGGVDFASASLELR